jgi:Cu/Ag efflux pump CusA
MEGVPDRSSNRWLPPYMLAIAASLVVAMTVTPALCLILLRIARLEGRESPVIVWLQRGYAPLLERATRTPRAAFITVGVVTLAGIGVWPLLGQSLMPSFKERDFLMHWVSSPDTSLPEMLRITTRASKELRAIPGVRNFGAHIGQTIAGGEVAGVNFGENWISIGREADYDKTHARIEEMVEVIRPLPRCANLSGGAHSRRPERLVGGDRGPRLRPGSRRSAEQGGGDSCGTRGHSGRRQPAQGVDC